MTERSATETVTGILKLTRRDAGELIDPKEAFPEGPPVRVGPQLLRRFRLPTGSAITGPVRRKGRNLELDDVESVCGLSPDEFARRTPFADLVAVDPRERIELSVTGDTSMRIVDLVAPIGKGTRALIVSPPKAGKTLMLEAIAHGVRQSTPEARLLVLLVDERPEEVTHFRRAVQAEVFARTNDQSPHEQVALVDIVLAMVRTELECGRDVVVLVDSLTRVGRAYNLKGSGTRRTMSGGVEAGALEVPRRLFGLA